MDDVRGKKAQYEYMIAKLKNEYPEMADIVPSSPGTDDTWIERVVERFHDRGCQKNREDKIKLAAQARRFYAEYRAAIDEYRGVLESHDDLNRVKGGKTFAEKDEEEALRQLERKKRRLALEREIKDLEKEPETSPARDARSPEQRTAEELERWKRELDEAVARCNEDPVRIAEINESSNRGGNESWKGAKKTVRGALRTLPGLPATSSRRRHETDLFRERGGRPADPSRRSGA